MASVLPRRTLFPSCQCLPPGGAGRDRPAGPPPGRGRWWVARVGLGVVGGGLAVGLGLPALAQDLPADSLEGAIGRCVGKEGATGDAVGDITIDLKTGKVVYRCDSDPTTKERVLVPGSLPAGPAAGSGVAGGGGRGTGAAANAAAPAAPAVPGGKPGAPDGTAPVPDFGADPAYVNLPRGAAPQVPQDCIGAHPYYMTFPVCVMARKMGLLDRQTAPSRAAAPQPAASTAAGEGAGAAAGPGPESPAVPIMAGEASLSAPHGTPTDPAGEATAPGSDQGHDQGHDQGQGQGSHDAAAAAGVAPAAAPTLTRTIGPLPDGADQAAAQAAERLRDETDGEAGAGDATTGQDPAQAPVGRVRPGTAAAGDGWVAWLIWGAVGLGGLMAMVAAGLGAVVLVNRVKMRRAGDADDPYTAYFDDPDEWAGAHLDGLDLEDDEANERSGPGLLAERDESPAPAVGASRGAGGRKKPPAADLDPDAEEPLAAFTA